MKKQAAGLLIYRKKDSHTDVLIVHNGGPWFKNKDKGYWSIPKGEYDDEDPKDAALREFHEELNINPPSGEWIDLGDVKQKGGKVVLAWAVEGDLDVSNFESNTVKTEWPPRSGKIAEWPEIDKAEWFSLKEAAEKINSAQVAFLKRLADKLGQKFEPGEDESGPSQQALL